MSTNAVPGDTGANCRWNHSTHYHRLVMDAVPEDAASALDVGTGDGLLAADLRTRARRVTGIDADADVLERARRTGADVSWLHGDVMTADLPRAHFDVVASLTTLHHLPNTRSALERLAELTAPGGVLVVIGCARSSTLHDRLMDAAGVLQHQVLSRTRGFWQHSAAVVPHVPHTYSRIRAIATDVLPGCVWRRLPLFRYAVIWHRPA